MAVGENPSLFTWLYTPVDSIVENVDTGKFDTLDLQGYGLAGWRLVAVVPKTIGIGLKNTSMGSTFGESWGGGLGGDVIGVYFIMQREIRDLDDPYERAEAEAQFNELSSRGFNFDNILP
jgi:hypothetical protein